MISIDRLRLFPFSVNEIAFPNNRGLYKIIVYPENTDFISIYQKLRIRRIFARRVGLIKSVVPRVIPTAPIFNSWKQVGLFPVVDTSVLRENFFVDTSIYMENLDLKFERGSYRRPLVSKRVKAYLNECVSIGQPDTDNVLLYVVDTTKPLAETLQFRRIWPLLEILRYEPETNPFQYILYVTFDGNSPKYRLMHGPTGTIPFSRMYSFSKTLTATEVSIDKEPEEKILKSISPVVSVDDDQDATEKNSNLLKSSIKSLTKISGQESELLKSEADLDPERFAIKSILYNVSGNLKKSEEIAKAANTPEKRVTILKKVKNEFLTDIVPRSEVRHKQDDPVLSSVDLYKVNDSKEPSQVLNKRVVDFEETFQRDISNVFKALSSKPDYPLKVQSVKTKKIEISDGDLEPTKEVEYSINLQDEKGNVHEVKIKIPEIQKDGTFMINGSKKFIIYQIVTDPIFFLKEGVGKLSTMVAEVSVRLKETKYKSYYQCFISGYPLPLFLLMGYQLGFNGVCRLFNITYQIVNSIEGVEGSIHYKTRDEKYIVFSEGDSAITTRRLVDSLKEIHIVISSDELGNSDLFSKILVHYIGHRNCIYKIDTVLSNIMEPVAVEILKSKLLPTKFEYCIKYICDELSKGRVDKRNDLNHQRIRSSEVFVYQIQKQIIRAYNEYRQKRIYGDTDAVYQVDTDRVVSDIINSQLMRTLENINPLEELSSLTRTTPIGPGGVPDGNSLSVSARNIDDSYFGNISAMDTPEGSTIGVVNQLTIDAAIGNRRGTFLDKTSVKHDGAGILSPMESMLPFINSCDGARVMLYCSQTKQAIPLVNTEIPLVQTGYETILTPLLSDSYVRKSPVDGIVTDVREHYIVVTGKDGKTHKVVMGLEKLNSAQGQDALNVLKPSVKVGQKVQSGGIVGSGKHIKDGIISIGTNMLTAVMGWKGYQLEDGYIISDYAAKEKFKSLAYDEIVLNVLKDDNVTFIAEEGSNTLKGQPLLKKISKDVEELIDLDDDEFSEGQIIKKSPGGKIMSIEIYPNVNLRNFPVLVNQFERFKKRYEDTKGKFPAKFTTKDHGNSMQYPGIRIVFKIEREEECNEGDKIANSHGGKGVLALIEKRENMPITPWGEPIDLILNPLAIINRMNPSSVFEMYTGLIAKFLANKVVEFGRKKNTAAIQLISKVFSVLDNTEDKNLSKAIINRMVKMSEKEYANYIDLIVARNYILPIIVPPFKEPKFPQLYEALKMVGADKSYTLRLPETNQKTLNKIACGYIYYKKNEQQASLKMSARSVGRYNSRSLQPTAGKKAGGGQRIGEFDSWCMASHGAVNVMREMFGPLSDDQATKDQIISRIIQTGSCPYMDPKATPTKDLLNMYFRALMLETSIEEVKK